MFKYFLFSILIISSAASQAAPNLHIAFLYLNNKYEIWHLDKSNTISKLVNEKNEVTHLSPTKLGVIFKANNLVKKYDLKKGTISTILEIENNKKGVDLAVDYNMQHLFLSYFNKKLRIPSTKIVNLKKNSTTRVNGFDKLPQNIKWIKSFSLIQENKIVEINTAGEKKRFSIPPISFTGNIVDFAYTSDKSIYAFEIYDDKNKMPSKIFLYKNKKQISIVETRQSTGITLSKSGEFLVYTTIESKNNKDHGIITILDTKTLQKLAAIRTERPVSFPIILDEN